MRNAPHGGGAISKSAASSTHFENTPLSPSQATSPNKQEMNLYTDFVIALEKAGVRYGEKLNDAGDLVGTVIAQCPVPTHAGDDGPHVMIKAATPIVISTDCGCSAADVIEALKIPGSPVVEFGRDGEDGTAQDGRPRFNISSREVASRKLRKKIGTGQLAGLFYREGELVHTPRIGTEGYIPPKEGEEDGPAQVQIMGVTELKTRIESRYSVGRNREKGSGDESEGDAKKIKVWEPTMFPPDVATHGHTAARMREGVPNLRNLAGVTHTPLLRPDGSVLDKPGYDDATRLLYLPAPGLIVPPVSAQPTAEQVDQAVELIRLIVDEFPFVEDHHRANWFGALLTPIMRTLLPPPYPMFVIDAPEKGSGKGYLAMILRTVHGGILRAGFPENDAELSKEVLGILMGLTAPVITFDNVRGTIKSAKLEALLTSPAYSARMLGQNREGSAPNDRLWTITANNADIGGDLARRCYWITIDPGRARPHEKTDFKIENLPQWVSDHRSVIIHGLLTIVRGWIQAGAPTPIRKRSDDYAKWDACLEGLINWAGLSSGQFGKPDGKHLDSSEDQEWETFVSAVVDVMGDQPFKMAELVDKIGTTAPFEGSRAEVDPALLPGDLADRWSRSQPGHRAGFTVSLGKWFGNRAGRHVAGTVLRIQRDRKTGSFYRFEQGG